MNKIDLKTFLALPLTERNAKKKICFQGAVYPLLFFTEYFSQNKKQGIPQQSLDVEMLSFQDIACQLEMAILGNSCLYWLKNLSSVAETTARHYVSYIQQYQGPHQIYFFMQQESVFDADVCIVVFPEVVDESLYRVLANFFQQEITNIDSFIKALFSHNKTVSFEQALLLIQYQLFLGRRFQLFVQDWLPRFITSEQSLFTLSQLFFARNYVQFLREWRNIRLNYPNEFWIAFWAEQIWQALIFIEHAKRGQLVEVRKKVFRLPFSFMNKDWKIYTEHELQCAHQFLYEIDYGMKNGYATDGIDLFLHSFLLRKFL